MHPERQREKGKKWFNDDRNAFKNGAIVLSLQRPRKTYSVPLPEGYPKNTQAR